MDTEKRKKSYAEKQLRKILDDSKNPFLVSEFKDLLRAYTFQQLEQIPEIRQAIGYAAESIAERRMIAESIGMLSHADIDRLFRDHIDDHLTIAIQQAMDKMQKAMVILIKTTFGRRLDQLEETIQDMRSSFMMAALNPFAWIEVEISQETCRFLTTQPNAMSSLHAIYQHLTYQTKLPLPGYTLPEKYEFVARTLRRVECIKEHEGLLFELAVNEIMEEGQRYATSDAYRSILSRALRSMDTTSTET